MAWVAQDRVEVDDARLVKQHADGVDSGFLAYETPYGHLHIRRRREAKQLVIELVNTTGMVTIDLGSLAKGGVMLEVGAPLSGLDLHFVRRLR